MIIRPHNAPEPRYMLLSVAAKYMGMTYLALWTVVKAGEMPAYQLGGRWFMDLHDIDAHIAKLKAAERRNLRIKL